MIRDARPLSLRGKEFFFDRAARREFFREAAPLEEVSGVLGELHTANTRRALGRVKAEEFRSSLAPRLREACMTRSRGSRSRGSLGDAGTITTGVAVSAGRVRPAAPFWLF